MTKAWGWNSQWQEYTYDADGRRVRRKVDGVETWQVYGFDGELLAEYAANAAYTTPQKEYGYRNGELLITAASTQPCGVGYSGSKTWTATNPSLGHATGQQEGSNWAVYLGSHSPNAMVFGPYDTSFGQGHHSAQFWLMVDNNSGTDVVATLDVVTGYGGNVLAQRQIRRNEFTGANQWQVFTLEFDNPCFGLLESRVWWSGTVGMKFNQLTITTTNTSAVDIEWLVKDQLGTPRMVVSKTGSLTSVKRHDYLPFGEELYVGVSSRSVDHGYFGDGARQKFTSYERDTETGLDYAQARYYGNTQGRFTGVDPLTASAKLAQPQSWNRFSYCINNPLRFIDPSGLIWGELNNQAQWFKSEEEMRKAGFSPMTSFLRRNPHGPGYLSFSRFQNHYEYVSSLAVAGGWGPSGESNLRTQGFTSREFPMFLAFDAAANGVDFLYRTKTAQGLINSQEAHFLSIYSGVAGVEFAAAKASRDLILATDGLAFELGFLQRHLPGTAESTKLAASRSSAFVFNDLSTLSRVESEIFARGSFTGATVQGSRTWLRFGVQFDQPIGSRIASSGQTTPLTYGQVKVDLNTMMYHVTPRSGP